VSSALRSPFGLLSSRRADKLYLASSANTSVDSQLHRLTFSPSGPSVSLDGSVKLLDMRQVVAVTENPSDGTLYVLGFQAPEIPEDLSTDDPLYEKYFSNSSSIFTSPRWAQIPASVEWSSSVPVEISGYAVNGSDLALPISAVFVPGGAPVDFDADGDVDLGDFNVFQGCFNGPNRPPRQTGCDNADLDGDHDVDLGDFNVFQGCFNGPNRPARCE